MSVINTNVSSLKSQNSLALNERKLSSAMERLSTGVRINSARDDAAGLAITTRMTSEIRGLTASVRNANDGISVAQTAEGSLGEITNILQRLRELSVQSANSSNNSTDRSFLNTEANQLISEVQRIGSQTSFNGIKLLDGTFTAQNFQVGANANEVIVFNSISSAKATSLGSNTLGTVDGAKLNVIGAAVDGTGTTLDNTVAGRASTDGFTITNAQGTSSAISYNAKDDAKAIAAAINLKTSSMGVVATATNSATLSSLSTAGTYSFTLGTSAISATIDNTADLTNLVAAINSKTTSTNITASFDSITDKSQIKLTSSDGADIKIIDFAKSGGAASSIKVDNVSLSGATGSTTDSILKVGSVSLASSSAVTIANGEANIFSVAGGSANSTLNAVYSIDISTQSGASAALGVLDAALTQVNNSRAGLGGLINRFEATVSNQGTAIMNLSASRSRILDTDYAVETTNLAKAQIIQQAATAMLAQANQSSQSVLALLK